MKPFQFGMRLLISLIVFGGLGWLLDSLLNTGPWLMIVGIFYAVIGSFVLLVWKSRKSS